MSKCLLIAPGQVSKIIFLPHPRTGQLVQFVHGDGKLLELLCFSTMKKRSVVFSDRIISSAPLYVASSFDITFLLIHLVQDNIKFLEVDEFLSAVPQAIHSLLTPHLSSVCDELEQVEGYWRFSIERAISYLMNKIARVQDALPESITHKLSEDSSIKDLSRQKAALELVTSYVSPIIQKALLQHYDFSKLTEFSEKQRSLAEMVNPNEFIRRKESDGEPAAKKLKKGSKGVESLKKVNTKGMKSMTSFFKAK